MDKDIFKRVKITSWFFIAISIIGIVSAVGFHTAEEITPGTFSGDYVFDGSIKSQGSEAVLFFRDVNKEGTPTGDGFRIRRSNDVDLDFGTNSHIDYLVIEKTDGNGANPDGGIALVNTGNDGVIDPTLVIRGSGNVGIGTSSPSAKLDVNGVIKSNGNAVWHAGNDGAGSGLDADLLDGKHGSYYLDNTDYCSGSTCSGDLTISGGNLYIGGDGEIRDAGTNYLYTPDRFDSGYQIRAPIFYDRDNSGYYANPASTSKFNSIQANIFYDLGNTGYYVNPAGTSNLNTVKGAAFYYSSDKRLKKNINPIKSSLNKLKKLEGVTFNWRENNESSIGFVAQDVEEVFPVLVNTNNKSGMKSVQYGNIVAVSIEAIKEQQDIIDELSSQQNLNEKKISMQQREIETLNKRLELIEDILSKTEE